MKKLLLIFFIFISINAQAQLEVSPDDLTKTVLLDMSDLWTNTKLNYQISNAAPHDTSLQWCIEKIAGPESWESQLTVNGLSGGAFSWGLLCNIDSAIN